MCAVHLRSVLCGIILIVLGFANHQVHADIVTDELIRSFTDQRFIDELLLQSKGVKEAMLTSNNESFGNDISSSDDSANTEAESDLQYNDQLCVTQFNSTFKALSAGELWALKMFDSWGKIPSGILSGNSYELGDFDTCIRVQQIDSVQPVQNIHGQYCLAQFYTNARNTPGGSLSELLWSNTTGKQPFFEDPIKIKGMDGRMLARAMPNMAAMGGQQLSLMVALCIPASCSPKFISRVFDLMAKRFRVPVAISLTDHMCTRPAEFGGPGREDSGVLQLVAIVVFAIIVVTIVASTAYDIYTTFYSQSNQSLVLISFSVYTNGQKLFHRQDISDAPTASTHLTCLNGIRVLSIVWVVFGHAYMMMAIGPLINTASILEWIERPYSMFLISATVSVDTFFLMSGLLVTWSLLKYLDQRQGRLNLGWFYMHRYIRLTPSLAAAILLCSALLRRFGEGPLWSTFLDVADLPCQNWWWTTLLYVQNYVNPDQMCMSHSWYLSVDMQLYLLAPVLVWPLWRFRSASGWFGRSLGFCILALLTVASMAATFFIWMANGFSGRMSANLLGGKRMELTYYPTHCRMGAWLIGVTLGYLMHQRRGRIVSIAKIWLSLGWALCLAILATVIFANYPLQSSSYPDSILAGATYESLSRVSWAAAVAWLIFACAHGYGGPINWFLSLSGWQPLARLSYAIYIVHLPLQMVLAAQVRVPGYFSDTRAISSFWGEFGLTLTLAVAWTLAFESPVLALERALLSGSSPIQKRQATDQRNAVARSTGVEATNSRMSVTDESLASVGSGTEHLERSATLTSSQEDLVRTKPKENQTRGAASAPPYNHPTAEVVVSID